MIKEKYFKDTSLDQDIVDELLPEFIEEITEEFGNLLESFNLGNLSEVQKFAHKIKGVSECYGAHHVESSAKAIEESINANPHLLIIEKIESLRVAINDIKMLSLV